MKRNKIIIILSFIAFNYLSCGHIDEANEGIWNVYIPLKNENKTDLALISELSNHMDTIYLSSNDNCIVGRIEDVLIDNDVLFIVSNNSILKFSIDGIYLDKIERRGRGHGEYISINRIDLLPSKKEIYIFDRNSKKILVYSYDGNFIRNIDLEDYPQDFAILPNGDLLYFTPQTYKGIPRRGLWKTDSLGCNEELLIPIDDSYKKVSIIDRYLVHIDSCTVGLMGIEDTDLFYNISSDTIKTTCRFSTDISMSKHKTRNNEIIEEPLSGYIKAGYFESNRLLIFEATDAVSTNVRVVVDKQNKKQYNLYSSDLKRIQSIDEAFPFFNYCYNGNFFTVLYANEILSNEKFYQDFFPTITSESNPVITILHSK